MEGLTFEHPKIEAVVTTKGDGTLTYEARNNVPPSWKEVFNDSLRQIIDVERIIKRKFPDVPFTPTAENVFNAFFETRLPDVKVVIVGMDPYHGLIKSGELTGEFQAQGMSFSINAKDPNIPSSLKNIYKEIKNEYPEFVIPNHGCLIPWARQGVLLLNKSLTTVPSVFPGGGPDAHGRIWDGFIEEVVNAIAETNNRCVYVLWGRNAQSIVPFLPGTATILTSAHPSGLSANRGFFGNNHFKLINEHLEAAGKTPINWQL